MNSKEFGLVNILIIVKHLQMNLSLILFGDWNDILLLLDGYFIGGFISLSFLSFFLILISILFLFRIFCIDRFAYDLVRKRRETIKALNKEKQMKNQEQNKDMDGEFHSGFRDLLSLYIGNGEINK